MESSNTSPSGSQNEQAQNLVEEKCHPGANPADQKDPNKQFTPVNRRLKRLPLATIPHHNPPTNTPDPGQINSGKYGEEMTGVYRY